MATSDMQQLSADKRSSRVRVLEAIQALSNYQQPVTSDSIARHTGLRPVTIADCIKELKERDEIWSPERGVYRLQSGETSVLVSVTVTPDGRAKIEKGDAIVELTPHEWRTQLAPLAAAGAIQTVAIEHAHHTLLLAERNRKLERRVAALEEKLGANPAQMDLLREPAPV